MKKILSLLIVAASATSIMSAQINWGSQTPLYNGTTQLLPANSSVQAYLVYLGGSGSTWGDFDAGSLLSGTGTAQSQIAGVTVGGDIVAGPNPLIPGFNVSPAGKPLKGLNIGDPIASGLDNLVGGASTFGVVFFLVMNDNPNEIFYFLSDTFVYTESGSAWNGTSKIYTFNASIPSGSQWTKVPEPATAAMALAGLALLFRRKRK